MRQRELAILLTLSAGRAQVVRPLLADSLLLSTLGAVGTAGGPIRAQSATGLFAPSGASHATGGIRDGS